MTHVTDRLSLAHLDRMTDSTGLIQHAIYAVPRRESGYTVDDNARALRLCVRLWRMRPDESMLDRVTRYLSLIEHARRPSGGFHNLMNFQRQWIDTDSSGDCQGHAARALAEIVASELPNDHRALALELLVATLPTIAAVRSMRAEASVIIGFSRLAGTGASCWTECEEIAHSAARHLCDGFARSSRPDWRWFESRMTYANALLPHAMMVAADLWPDEGFRAVADDSFAFLDAVTTVDGVFAPVGNDRWFSHGEAKSQFDQQPIDAQTMVDASIAAIRFTGEEHHAATLRRAWSWFHGRNMLGRPLADPSTGACCDGLQPGGVNRNQGAESTLAYLFAELLYGTHTDESCATVARAERERSGAQRTGTGATA
jgi:hypothetical protein